VGVGGASGERERGAGAGGEGAAERREQPPHARREDRTRLRNPALTPILNQAGLAAFDFASAPSPLACLGAWMRATRIAIVVDRKILQ